MIYELVLPDNNLLDRQASSTSRTPAPESLISGRSLLALNQQIHNEAIEVLYKKNYIRTTVGRLCERRGAYQDLMATDFDRVRSLYISGSDALEDESQCARRILSGLQLVNFLDRFPLLQKATVDFRNMTSFAIATRELFQHPTASRTGGTIRLQALAIGVINIKGHQAAIMLRAPGLAHAWLYAAIRAPLHHFTPTIMQDPRFLVSRPGRELLRSSCDVTIQLYLQLVLQRKVEGERRIPIRLRRFFGQDPQNAGGITLRLKGRADSLARMADFTISLAELLCDLPACPARPSLVAVRWDFGEGVR
ncbi:hypothetical protein LTR85_008953 [Meristemomyces frigidus]|nr:hypothetical protein LTR85_008953 [Meristemomyces frigidus]